MNRIAVLILLACMAGTLTSCDELLNEKKKSPPAAEKPRVVHHFELITRSEGSLAVDSATGQMCKTWDWGCAKPTYKNPYTGQWEENSSYGIQCSAIATMPLCANIAKAEVPAGQPVENNSK